MGKMKKRMIRALTALVIAVTVSCACAPASADGMQGSLFMYVDTGNPGKLHLRARPDSGSESLGLYRNGTRVLVEGFANSCWAAVLVNGRRGYMNTRYLSGCAPVQAAAPNDAARCLNPGNSSARQQVVVSNPSVFKPMYVSTGCGSLHLRAYASRNADSLGLFPSGTQVYAIDLGNGWSYVLANGVYGCMMTQYLSPMPEPVYAAQNVLCSQTASIPSWRVGAVVTVRNPNSSFVYLRSSKDSDRRDNILSQVPVGAQAVLLEHGEYWSRILYEGVEGFMVSRYLN